MPSQFVLDSGLLNTDLLGPVVIVTASADLEVSDQVRHLLSRITRRQPAHSEASLQRQGRQTQFKPPPMRLLAH